MGLDVNDLLTYTLGQMASKGFRCEPAKRLIMCMYILLLNLQQLLNPLHMKHQ